ncbi:MAG: Gfo/Idh/MocA family oxidoreductase [Jaaginema sp. PMC 1079.18]|nr:Gfo/Idh/MocA family oxidoreductase [Jaaginema sp. PMC 1080.18]MEC4849981.1 Gfo/Idh/MocA family oxidoreductase [Jaaginema sp. PMC 1079.18]MEC4865189.1 Gfo/Idh/MocA family oxidoreductase [Jaaginema sp. PMC 1078.18]
MTNNKQQTIDIAVLGVGRWGQHLVRNLAQHSQVNLVALVDPHLERLQQVRDRLALSSKLHLASDWQEIRTLAGLKAVVIATPATTHYDLIKEALQSGYHVLAEKPLTLDAAECLELGKIAQQQQVQLMVDHTYLFHPGVAAGQKVVASGNLGELRYGYASRTNLGPVRYDVDALWDLAIHDLCIFNYWLGEIPIAVAAQGQNWLPHNQGLTDTVWLQLTYPGGFRATIHVSWLNPDKQRRLAIAGSEGTLIFDELQADSPLRLRQGYFREAEGHFYPEGVTETLLKVDDAEPLGQVCDRFITAITTQTPSFSSATLAANLVQILQGAQTSLQQGGNAIALTPLR